LQQIADAERNPKDQQLIEVGPRFVLDIVRIFSGSYCGTTMYANPTYTSPNQVHDLGHYIPMIFIMIATYISQESEEWEVRAAYCTTEERKRTQTSTRNAPQCSG